MLKINFMKSYSKNKKFTLFLFNDFFIQFDSLITSLSIKKFNNSGNLSHFTFMYLTHCRCF